MRPEDVGIANPCEEDWDRMRPEAGGRRRWCDSCERQVHDLSRMSERAARALLASGADVCVAYHTGVDGKIEFEDEAREAVVVPIDRLRRRPQRRPAVAAELVSAASLAVLLAACTTHGEEELPIRAEIIEQEREAPRVAAPELVIPHEPPPAQPPADHEVAEPCDPEPSAEGAAKPKPPSHPPLVKGRRNKTKGIPLGGSGGPLDGL